MAVIRGENQGSSWVASGDLTGYQWRLVAISGNDVYVPATGTAAKGILTNKPKNNEHASVVDHGHCKVQAGEAISQMTAFAVGVSGHASLVVSGAYAMGYVETTAASGEIVSCFVQPGYGARTA